MPIEKPEDIHVTKAMIDAGIEQYPCDDDGYESKTAFLINIFRAMRLAEIKNTGVPDVSLHEHKH